MLVSVNLELELKNGLVSVNCLITCLIHVDPYGRNCRLIYTP